MYASGVLASLTSRGVGAQAAHNNMTSSDFTGRLYSQESSVTVLFVKESGAPHRSLYARLLSQGVFDQFFRVGDPLRGRHQTLYAEGDLSFAETSAKR